VFHNENRFAEVVLSHTHSGNRYTEFASNHGVQQHEYNFNMSVVLSDTHSGNRYTEFASNHGVQQHVYNFNMSVVLSHTHTAEIATLSLLRMTVCSSTYTTSTCQFCVTTRRHECILETCAFVIGFGHLAMSHMPAYHRRQTAMR
jgi:hypothetical protein